MKIPLINPLLALAASLLVPGLGIADTVVNFGSVVQVAGAGDVDLAGEMTHAVNFSANDPARTVNGVVFTPDTTPPVGATFVGPNEVTPWQTKPEFGGGADNDALEEIFADIRWANNGAAQALEAHLPVTAGQTYKLQVLFYGNHPEDRKWDIEVEGALAVDEISSLGASVGGVNPDYSPNAGLIYTATLPVTDDMLDVRFVGQLDGSNDDGAPDRNPIWQAITVEHIVGDADGDGMLDSWETQYFGNLSRDGTGDFDSDGLTDLQEFSRDTKPNNVDTDGDTLNDGAEVNTHLTDPKSADSDGDGLTDPNELNTTHTDPTKADTDFDGLNDGAELSTHSTDPLKADTDADSYDDGFEVVNNTNPLSATSYPLFAPQAKGINGGDVGDGLDLDGTFIAAVRFGTDGQVGSWPVRDATFIPFDTLPGLTQNAVSRADNWLLPTFATDAGATQDDINLGEAVDSISYTSPIVDITIPGLTSGKAYKVQLLFGEQCCNNRGFDVYLEDVLVADEFATGPAQGGASGTPARVGAVVAAFIATDATLNIRLDHTTITSPGLGDSNAIINALTVEELPALPDTDTDGLPDAWELINFGNTSQTAAGDPDADGLANLGEFQGGTNPNDPDSDDDGLNDGAEVNTQHTDPKKADTDGDGLSDGAEVSTHSTNPLNVDSDADGYGDGNEIANGTNPNSALSFPFLNAEAKGFTGGDAGEGLDLDGTFLYAINIGTNGAPGQVRDANFTDDAVAGAIVTAQNEIGAWNTPAYGDTANDDAIEMVIQSIRWSAAPVTVNATLDGLTVGKPYKIQLLFGEQCCNRGFDILVNGTQILDDFSPRTQQGGIANPSRGAVAVYGFYATSTTLDIVLDGTNVADPSLTDHNATLSGITVEELPPFPDTDADGLPDFWEYNEFGNLNQAAAGDPDADGLTNAGELLASTDPNDSDTDNDTLLDGVETNTGTFVSASNTGTDPLRADTDGDTLNDNVETNTGIVVSLANTGSNPNKADTDDDTWTDLTEVQFGSNPSVAASVPSYDLVWWSFDDASRPLASNDMVHNVTANFLNGAAFSADGTGRTGAAGDRALNFALKANQMGKVPGAQWLNLAAAGDTIALAYWQNLTAVSDSVGLWGSSPSSSGGGRGFSNHSTWSNNNYYFDTVGCCDGGTQRINGPNDVNLVNNWHHLVFQKNGPDKQIWVDGVLKVSGSNTSELPSDFTELTIGAEPTGANNMLGRIDDVAIFGDALTEEQIARLTAGESPASILAPPSSTIAFTSISYDKALNQIVLTWSSSAGKTYTLQSSETLSSWPTEINDNIASGGATTTYTHNLTTAYPGGNPEKLFYRVTQN